jgi:hypothetical protein
MIMHMVERTRIALSAYQKWWLLGVIAVLLVSGSYFRIAGLNATSLHGDGIIHDVCKMGATPVQIFTKWDKLIGPTGQLATPAAFTKLFLDIFRLAPTMGNIILPSACWGILTILAALWVGWRLGGRWFGLLLMAVVAFNPVHIQMSRTAYFYQPCILGAFIMVWCLMESWESFKSGRRLSWRFHSWHGVAVILLLYSSANTWPLACFFAAFLAGISVIKARRKQVGIGESAVIACTYVLFGLPLLFVSWGVPALVATTQASAQRDYGRRIFELLRAKPMMSVVVQEFSRLGWGWTAVRLSMSCVLFAVGASVLGLRMRRGAKWGFPLISFGIGLLLAVIAIQSSSWPFGLRRVSVIWPAGFIIYAAGLAWPWLIELPKRWRTVVWVGWGGFVIVLFGMWLNVNCRALKATGFLIPYRQIGQWMDGHFPKGTPVVTDRFYTAMCEFNQAHPTTNVVVISMVPNELPEIQEKTRFRDVARQYFEDNPDAVFYCAGHMYERPEIVPWDWPDQYFKRDQRFKDEHAALLALIGQSYHYDSTFSRAVWWPLVYYNTIEDVVAIQRAKGAVGFVLWGPEWRPVQTQDYRLWRLLLSGDAGLKVYGLGETAQDLTLELTGVAAGGELRVQVGDQTVTFPANQMAQQKIPVKIEPGVNVLRVRCRGTANARLLIAKAEVK